VPRTVARSADLRVAAGEGDRGRLNKSTKVLIVESWVHHELETRGFGSHNANL
jgi:hypothetical protein